MELLTQEAMGRLFAVTDPLGLDREHLSVPLERGEEGHVARGPDDRWQIALPAGEAALTSFLDALPDRLRQAGFVGPDGGAEAWA